MLFWENHSRLFIVALILVCTTTVIVYLMTHKTPDVQVTVAEQPSPEYVLSCPEPEIIVVTATEPKRTDDSEGYHSHSRAFAKAITKIRQNFEITIIIPINQQSNGAGASATCTRELMMLVKRKQNPKEN